MHKDVSRASRQGNSVYRSDNIITGVFEILGKMIASSLVQGEPGFPYLSPLLYWYIATGDQQQELTRASCIDVADTVLANYLKRVSLFSLFLVFMFLFSSCIRLPY